MQEDNAPENNDESLVESENTSGIGVEGTGGAEDTAILPEVDVPDAVMPGNQHPGAAPTKVCASCSVQSQTDGAFCPNCGKAFNRSRSLSKRGLRLTAIIIAAVVVIGGGATAIALTTAHNSEVAVQAAAKKAAKDAEKAKVAKAAASARAKEAADTAERTRRATSVTEIEASITTDAQRLVTEETLEGPITKSSCTPLGGGSTDYLTALTTTFTCIAINKENADGTSSGYRFSATMDWSEGSYSWHLGD